MWNLLQIVEFLAHISRRKKSVISLGDIVASTQDNAFRNGFRQ